MTLALLQVHAESEAGAFRSCVPILLDRIAYMSIGLRCLPHECYDYA